MKNNQSTIQKIGEYKMDILNRILESDKLTKLIAHDTRDCLFKDSIEDPYSLLYDRVFPYRFVPNPTEDQRTFVTLGTGGFTRHQEGYKIFDDYVSGGVYFYIFTHVDLMRTDSGVRQDIMLGEIDRLFNGKRGLGMGELKLNYCSELWMHNNKFGGYTISFTVTDLK